LRRVYFYSAHHFHNIFYFILLRFVRETAEYKKGLSGGGGGGGAAEEDDGGDDDEGDD
jgi:hypothetical protein